MHKFEAIWMLAIVTGAYLMPVLSKKFMLPSAVGEIFYGLILGTILLKYNLNLPTPIYFMSELGFILLMYIAGLELDVDKILNLKRKECIAYGFFAIILVSASYAAVYFTNLPPFFTLVIMTTAIGLLYAVLKELDIVKTAIGQSLILLGVIGEVITLLGITILSLASKNVDSISIIKSIAGICFFIFIIILAMKLLKLFIWWNPQAKSMFMSVGNPSETGVRANLLNMFLFVCIATLVNLEAILGAFFGGLIFARLFVYKEEMLERLSSFGYGFLIPLFFIEVGTRFKLSDFTEPVVIKSALLVILLMFIVRLLATFPLIFTDVSFSNLIYVPFAHSFPLTLLIAVAMIGDRAGLIDNEHTSIIVLTALISSVIFPWLIKFINKGVPVES